MNVRPFVSFLPFGCAQSSHTRVCRRQEQPYTHARKDELVLRRGNEGSGKDESGAGWVEVQSQA